MLKIAIVGLPNVGKSTLFNALTNSSALAANYPFATIEPNTGIVPVPDDRLESLAKLYGAKKTIPATVEFVDVAGLVAGASKGEGLGNKFLANIRECDAICHVVRAFSGDRIQRADGSSKVDPKGDIEVINTELMLADIATIENHLPKLIKQAKSDSKLKERVDFLTYVQSELMAGKIPREFSEFDPNELTEKLNGLNLLTAKPIIYLFNCDENTLLDTDRQSSLANLATEASGLSANSVKAIFVCAELESEIRSLSKAEAKELLSSYGVKTSGLGQLIVAAYDILGLQSFLTAGEKEVRAWTIKKGSTAPQAAGAIHSDFERGFIAAQVINYYDLISAGSEASARSLGQIRTEGKNYIMQPDDVVEFKFNV